MDDRNEGIDREAHRGREDKGGWQVGMISTDKKDVLNRRLEVDR